MNRFVENIWWRYPY